MSDQRYDERIAQHPQPPALLSRRCISFDPLHRLSKISPIWILLAVSFTCFIPLAIFQEFKILSKSSYEESVKSLLVTVFLGCTLTSLFPLVIDLSLDLISSLKIECLLYRSVSVFTVVFTTIAFLVLQRIECIATVSLTLSVWGYFIEMSLVFCFLNNLLPSVFTTRRIFLITFGLYFTFMGMIFKVLSTTSSKAAYIFHDAVYTISIAAYSLCVAHFLRILWKKYTGPAERCFTNWIKCLNPNEECAIIIIAGLTTIIIVHLLLVALFYDSINSVSSLDAPSVVIVESGKIAVGIFTYIISSRFFRQKLIVAKTNLETRSEIIQYISHEVRTPLGVIDVGLSLVLMDTNDVYDDNDNEEDSDVDKSLLRSRANDMREATHMITNILDDLLLYEKIESNTLALCMTEENPFLLVERIVSSHKRDFISVMPFRDEVDNYRNFRISVDKTMFQIIIDGLLSPALRSNFTDGDVNVMFDIVTSVPRRRLSWISPVVPEETARSSILITIVDTRSRITPESLPVLSTSNLKLERFGHNDGRDNLLALWLSTKLLRRLSSELKVEADDTRIGTVYKFEFDLVWGHSSQIIEAMGDIVEEVNSEGNRIEPFLSDIDRKLINGLTVLLIDDSSMTRKLVGQFLRRLGHICYDAEDGEKGVSLFQELSQLNIEIDVILMDFQMPVMTGPAATSLLRSNCNFEGVILGVTGNLLEADVQSFIASGVDGVLEKPLTAEAFDSNYKLAAMRKADRILV